MSSLNSVKFTCTALQNSNKKGLLTPDSEGYYTTVLGALNVFNSSGEYYTAEGVRELFDSSGLLQKRIQKGRLRGECGHPKQLPGESDNAYINRIFMINEEKVACHFKEICLDDSSVKTDSGQPVIAIIGKFIPSGPYGDALQKSVNNPNENVCFSIRAFTDDKRIHGINNRYLKTIVTWDWVNDCGIPVAEKWKSPGLESLGINELDGRNLSRGQLERAINSGIREHVAQEAAVMNANELFASMGWNIPKDGNKPAFTKW